MLKFWDWCTLRTEVALTCEELQDPVDVFFQKLFDGFEVYNLRELNDSD